MQPDPIRFDPATAEESGFQSFVNYRMPGRLRRLWCELTGGHRLWIGESFMDGRCSAVRVHCQRCGPLSPWWRIRARLAQSAPKET